MEAEQTVEYNSMPMELERVVRLAFVVYCTTVGVVLVLIPWTPGWDRMVAHVPYTGLQLLQLPAVRGGLSGFGLIHLVWGLHDLRELLFADSGHVESRSEIAGDQ